MKPTVVVVDDDPAIVDLVCDVLSDEDVKAVACLHGHEANPCIQTTIPDLVILDVQMPGVDGVEVFRRMRSDPTTSHIPVIFFTANAQKLKQWLPEYSQLGAKLLPKPFNVVDLLNMVDSMLAEEVAD